MYCKNIEALDISEFMVVNNTVSCRQDIAILFYENKLGIDVDVRKLFDHFVIMIS